MKQNITGTTDDKPTRAGAVRAMLLVATFAGTLALGACGGNDEAKNDGNYVPPGDASGTTTGTAPGGGTTQTTPGAPDLNTTTAPPPSAAVVRSELAEKFDKMGGMQRVNIEADGSGVVTLSGTVKSSDRKQTAEDAAAMVPGVVRVRNEIRVEE